MDDIERIRDKGADNNYTASTQDINKNMRVMKLLTQQYNQATEELKKLQAQANKTPKGAKRDEQHKRIREEQKAIRAEYQRTLAMFREIASYQQKYSKNFNATVGEINLPTQDFEKAKEVISGMVEESNKAKNKLDEVVTKIREVNKLDRRSESLSRRASASKYMSFQQASNFRKDRSTVEGYHQEKADNLRVMTEMSTQVSSLMKQIKKIEENPTATRADMDRKLEMQKNIEAMDKEFESRIELNRVLDRTIANMEKYNKTVQNVTVKPERGTFKGMAYERAPAIGLAITGAMAAALGSLYHQGASIDKGMRQDEISIGQRIGMDGSQWREDIRNNALNSGLKDKLGMSGQEMIGFQENYLSKRGYSGMDDLNTAMQNQAVFSRVSGINTEDTKSFFNTVYGAGPVNGQQTKEIQNAFLGAIKRSGMEGREKDQLKALDGILSGMSDGRSMTNDEIMNTMGLQSVLAQTGERSLQGEKGGKMLQSLDQGIRNGIDNPMVRMVFGQGTKYQGLAGRWELTKRLEKGISDIDNVNDMASFAASQGGTKEEQNMNFHAFARNSLGADITTQQAEAFMEAYRKGDLSDKNIQKILKEDTGVGGKASKEKMEEYKKSSAATNNQSDAVTEKQAAGIYDMGEAVRDVNASMGGLPPVVYGAIAALGALTVAFAAAATSFAISAGVRKVASSSFGGGGGKGKGGRGGGTGGGGGPTVVGGGSGGRQDRGGSGNTVAWNRGSAPANGANAPKQSWWNKMFGGGSGATEGAVAAGSTAASSGKGFLKSAGKVAGKVALPLAILTSVADIFSAPEGKKGEAIGSSVGGIGGGIAAGAAVGSVFPGIGTVIGGIIGGIAGAWGGGKVGSMFDSDPAKEKKEAEAKIKKEKEKAENRATNSSSITGFGHQGGTMAGHTATSMTVGATVGATATTMANNLDPGLTNQVVTPSAGNNVNSTNTQVDKENTNTKQRTEVKKTDNLSYERENLNIYERALMKAEQLLAQARSQNGIFGNGNGAGGAGGVGGGTPLSAGAGSLKLLPAGQKWQNAGNLQQSDLAYSDGALTAEDLDAWINSKTKEGSMMRGMGATFLKAGQQYGLDPRYLIAHAAEETGWGTSDIAKKKNNFFGIGAFDNSPMESAFTFNEGGGSAAEKGIMGGAKWIAENYYGKGRTTLDKMHQAGYATNSDWASNIASIMKNAPNGSGSINATINVNVKGDESVAKKINDNKEMKKVGNNIADMLGFYSKEMVMV